MICLLTPDMVPEQPVSIVFGHIGGLVLSIEVSTNDSTDLLANFWKGLTEKKRERMEK